MSRAVKGGNRDLAYQWLGRAQAISTIGKEDRVKLKTVDEVAEEMRVTPGTVYKWIKEGLLDADKLPSGVIRISEEAIEKFMGRDKGGGDAVGQPAVPEGTA